MNGLISGAMVLGYFVAGLFFLKFWKKSRDPLFVYFAVAFWILCGQRFGLSLTAERMEDDTVFYIVRLLAFLLILAAILHKNRTRD